MQSHMCLAGHRVYTPCMVFLHSTFETLYLHVMKENVARTSHSKAAIQTPCHVPQNTSTSTPNKTNLFTACGKACLHSKISISDMMLFMFSNSVYSLYRLHSVSSQNGGLLTDICSQASWELPGKCNMSNWRLLHDLSQRNHLELLLVWCKQRQTWYEWLGILVHQFNTI